MREGINCDLNTIDKNDLVITMKHTGPQIPISFHHVFCYFCETNTVLKLLDKYKDNFGEPSNPLNLIANWDILKIPYQFCAAVGCLLPFDKDVVTGSNSLRFIKKPTDHVNSTHQFTADSESSRTLKKKKRHFKNHFLQAKLLLLIHRQIKLP